VQDAVVAASGEAPIAPEDPLRALRLVAPEEVKVVILGQDPYPIAGHADGLAFSAGRAPALAGQDLRSCSPKRDRASCHPGRRRWKAGRDKECCC
jgi:hypothetical protein